MKCACVCLAMILASVVFPTPGGPQKIMEQIAIQSYMQLADKKNATVKIPLSIPLSGWAETTSGRGGWAMDMRRDKVREIKVWSEPVKRKDLTSKIVTKTKK